MFFWLHFIPDVPNPSLRIYFDVAFYNWEQSWFNWYRKENECCSAFLWQFPHCRRVLHAAQCPLPADWLRQPPAQLLQHQPGGGLRRGLAALHPDPRLPGEGARAWPDLGSPWPGLAGLLHHGLLRQCHDGGRSRPRAEDAALWAAAEAGEVSGRGDAEVAAGGDQWPHEAPGAAHWGRRGEDTPGQVLQSKLSGGFEVHMDRKKQSIPIKRYFIIFENVRIPIFGVYDG